MNTPEDGMQVQQDGRVQLRVASNASIGCLLWIIDIELGKGWLETIWWYESTHEMVECAMNAK